MAMDTAWNVRRKCYISDEQKLAVPVNGNVSVTFPCNVHPSLLSSRRRLDFVPPRHWYVTTDVFCYIMIVSERCKLWRARRWAHHSLLIKHWRLNFACLSLVMIMELKKIHLNTLYGRVRTHADVYTYTNLYIHRKVARCTHVLHQKCSSHKYN